MRTDLFHPVHRHDRPCAEAAPSAWHLLLGVVAIATGLLGLGLAVDVDLLSGIACLRSQLTQGCG